MEFRSDDKKSYGRVKRLLVWSAVLPSLLFLTQVVISAAQAWEAYTTHRVWAEHLAAAQHLFGHYIDMMAANMWQHLATAGFSLAALAGVWLFLIVMLRIAAKRVHRSTVRLTDETLEVQQGINVVRIPWTRVDAVTTNWRPIVGRRTIIRLLPEAGQRHYLIPDVYEISSDKLAAQIDTFVS